MRKYTLEERQARSVIKSALKAIRAHCLECVGGSVEEVEKCTGPLCIGDHGICPLHSYRFGKGRRSGIKAKASPVKAIAKHCLWCCGGSAIERKLCPSTKCWLYPFREGKNPFLSDRAAEASRRNAAIARQEGSKYTLA